MTKARIFRIYNKRNDMIDFLDNLDFFGISPEGLGTAFENEFSRSGTNFIGSRHELQNGQFTINLLFGMATGDPYGKYAELLDLLNHPPYHIEYITSTGSWMRECILNEFTKSEINDTTLLTEQLTLDFTTPWFNVLSQSSDESANREPHHFDSPPVDGYIAGDTWAWDYTQEWDGMNYVTDTIDFSNKHWYFTRNNNDVGRGDIVDGELQVRRSAEGFFTQWQISDSLSSIFGELFTPGEWFCGFNARSLDGTGGYIYSLLRGTSSSGANVDSTPRDSAVIIPEGSDEAFRSELAVTIDDFDMTKLRRMMIMPRQGTEQWVGMSEIYLTKGQTPYPYQPNPWDYFKATSGIMIATASRSDGLVSANDFEPLISNALPVESKIYSSQPTPPAVNKSVSNLVYPDITLMKPPYKKGETMRFLKYTMDSIEDVKQPGMNMINNADNLEFSLLPGDGVVMESKTIVNGISKWRFRGRAPTNLNKSLQYNSGVISRKGTTYTYGVQVDNTTDNNIICRYNNGAQPVIVPAGESMYVTSEGVGNGVSQHAISFGVDTRSDISRNFDFQVSKFMITTMPFTKYYPSPNDLFRETNGYAVCTKDSSVFDLDNWAPYTDRLNYTAPPYYYRPGDTWDFHYNTQRWPGKNQFSRKRAEPGYIHATTGAMVPQGAYNEYTSEHIQINPGSTWDFQIDTFDTSTRFVRVGYYDAKGVVVEKPTVYGDLSNEGKRGIWDVRDTVPNKSSIKTMRISSRFVYTTEAEINLYGETYITLRVGGQTELPEYDTMPFYLPNFFDLYGSNAKLKSIESNTWFNELDWVPMFNDKQEIDNSRSNDYYYGFANDLEESGSKTYFQLENNSRLMGVVQATPLVVSIKGPAVNPYWEIVKDNQVVQSDGFNLDIGEGFTLEVSSIPQNQYAVLIDPNGHESNVYQQQSLNYTNFAMVPVGVSTILFHNALDVSISYREESVMV